MIFLGVGLGDPRFGGVWLSFGYCDGFFFFLVMRMGIFIWGLCLDWGNFDE